MSKNNGNQLLVGGVDASVRGLSTRGVADVETARLDGVAAPDPEVPAQAKRRRFSASYKARIVQEAERCTESGAIGALLRREGLYSSQLSRWRELYRTGALAGLRDDKRGRKKTKHPLEEEVARLRQHNERLVRRIEQAETIIEIQKKVAAMLGLPLNSVENEESR